MDDGIENRMTEQVRLVDQAIRERVTVKYLAESTLPVQMGREEIASRDNQVQQAVEVAGWAPFHYDRKQDAIAEPWRFTVFFHEKCRQLANDFNSLFADIKPNNKIPRMLAACGALVLVTWIPEKDPGNEKLTQINEEHLAATSAATQNLLIALQARGLGTYWSSGGQLGQTDFFKSIEVPVLERLIAAVFVNYPGLYAPERVEQIVGKNRAKRSEWQKWTRVID